MKPVVKQLALDVAPLVVLAGTGIVMARDSAPKAVRRRWYEKAAERDRGRLATRPWRIPLSGWKDILLRTKTEFTEDQVPMIAAGMTFYALLALFPALGAFVALYGLFADVGQMQQHLAALSVVIPGDALRFLGEQMLRLSQANEGGLSLAFAAGLLTSIWSANGAAKALITGLNIAYEETERRGLVKRTLVSLAFTLGFLAFGICAFGVISAGPAVEGYFGAHAARLFGWMSWPLLAAAMVAGLAAVYRWGPSRDPPKFAWISPGSAAAVVLWIAVSAAFSFYVTTFAHYDRTYGPLGAVVGFMMWSWLSAQVVLLGAELNSEIEHQTAVDTTQGPPKPMGFRRAKMADTVAPRRKRRTKKPPEVQRAA
jgi:membrane protein